jgi:hypothetical protein
MGDVFNSYPFVVHFIIFYFNVTAIPLFVSDPKPMGSEAILEEEQDGDGLFTTYTDD